MIDIVRMEYNPVLPVWVILMDGIIYQCCQTEEEALKVAYELRGET